MKKREIDKLISIINDENIRSTVDQDTLNLGMPVDKNPDMLTNLSVKRFDRSSFPSLVLVASHLINLEVCS